MILLDVNVVLAAHRDDHPHHGSVRPWLDDLLATDRPFTVPDTVWASFLRLATNRRVFETPTPRDEAFAFCWAVRAQPGHVALDPGEAHLAIFERLCRQYDVVGDLVPDAYLAALALEHGCRLASLDRDFARFTELDWVRPGED